jgi:hypothetical protein
MSSSRLHDQQQAITTASRPLDRIRAHALLLQARVQRRLGLAPYRRPR